MSRATYYITERVIDEKRSDKTGMYPLTYKWIIKKQTTSERVARRVYNGYLITGREVYLTLE